MTTVVVITSGATYTVPADFGALVKIEAIGGGTTSGYSPGGGGAYAAITALAGVAALNVYNIQVGQGNGSYGSGTAPTGNTWFKDGSTLVAAGGQDQYGSSLGGLVANCVGTTKFRGGNGAGFLQGGGGAAGPSGAGGDGTATNGGTGDNGTGGVGGGPGVNGADGSEMAGGAAGAGGGGGSPSPYGADGGSYGGGSGGGGSFGKQGVIVFTYTPAAAAGFFARYYYDMIGVR